MDIVVLDGYTLNPGDLSWDGLGRLGNLRIYDRTAPELTIQRAQDAAIVLTNKTQLSREIIAALPALRYIGILATGTNVVDLDHAREQGIVVTNVPAYSTRSVAQHTLALLLELCHQVQLHNAAVHQGDWSRSLDFSFRQAPLIELAGKTLGIIGLGQIGRQVAAIAEVLGMRVIACGRQDGSAPALDALLAAADVVSLHCPLTPQTQGMINARRLALMKSSAFLINTARGPLVVEEDLADALNRGVIAGAGLDVLSIEPPRPDNPLLSARNCIITPHIAWASHEARERLMTAATENVRCFLAGDPVNEVNA
jgi:glycerate dehydrogenase